MKSKTKVKTKKQQKAEMPVIQPVLPPTSPKPVKSVKKASKTVHKVATVKSVKHILDKPAKQLKPSLEVLESKKEQPNYLKEEKEIETFVEQYVSPSAVKVVLNKMYSFVMAFITYPYLKKLAQFARYCHFRMFLVPRINKNDGSVVVKLNKLRKQDLEDWSKKLHHKTYAKLLEMSFVKQTEQNKTLGVSKVKDLTVKRVEQPTMKNVMKEYNFTKSYILALDTKELLNNVDARMIWKKEAGFVTDALARAALIKIASVQ